VIHPPVNRSQQELKGIEHSRHLFSPDSPNARPYRLDSSQIDNFNIQAIRDHFGCCRMDRLERLYFGTNKRTGAFTEHP
jgi:hypothetical protein